MVLLVILVEVLLTDSLSIAALRKHSFIKVAFQLLLLHERYSSCYATRKKKEFVKSCEKLEINQKYIRQVLFPCGGLS